MIKISPKLTDIKYTGPVPRNKKARQFNEKDKANKRVRFPIESEKLNSFDEAIQGVTNSFITATLPLSNSFDGCSANDNVPLYGSTFAPPDPNMCVGPNHIVQMVNSAHKVFDKSGNLLSGPIKFSSIASTSQDDGDPIVLYDQLADRWMLLQFNLPAGSESIIFCISQTPDPTGAYFVYEFPTVGVFPDYPHVGIWNNSYVITTHEFNQAGTSYLGQGFYAVDRTKMVNGEATSTLIRFQDTAEGGYLPASMEGFKTPESSSDAIFTSFNANEFGGNDELWIRTLHANFTNPASSTLSVRGTIPVAAFDGRSPSSRSAIEQPGTTDGLDAITDRMMSRVVYRRFDNSESLIMNYGVNVSGANPTTKATFQAAMRWYELSRANPASSWTINQQSTYAPSAISGTTGENRWMGSVGIDQKGNIALAYSKSSATTFPSINYAERKKTDPLNTLGAEQIFFDGTGSQTGSGNRWGDYTSMATDPSDEETLWYTNEYYQTTSSYNWKTRIGSFKINDPQTTPTVHFKKGGTITRQVESVTPASGPPNLPYKDYMISVVIDQAPTQPVNITFNKSGTATEGVDYDLLIPTPFVLNAGTTSKDFTLRVYDNAFGESDEFINIDYVLNVNGGSAIAGSYNQKHRITIIGKSSCPTLNVSFIRPTTFCEGDSTTLSANTDPNYSFQWYKNDVAIPSATQAQLVVKQSGSYYVEITSFGCSLPSAPILVTANLGVQPPTTISRTITFGTTLTPGNGLQASASCAGQNTVTYAGPTIGYDGGTKSGDDPQVTVSGVGTNLGKVKVAITWRKRSGGTINDCGTEGGTAKPYYNEVSFKIQAPNGATINLLNSGVYGQGTTTLGSLTTTFEDGGSTIGALPAAGTFAPAQLLAILSGINPNGVWKLIANDNEAIDPLCVESFSITVFTSGTGVASTIKWYSNATGGSPIATNTEYIPTDTAPGNYTYYAEAGCAVPGLICNTSIRKPATLTITGTCVSIGGIVTNNATVCAGTNAGILTLSGHTGTILRWESSTDDFLNITTIAKTTTTLNYLNLTQTTKFRAVVQNGSCLPANSSAATINVTTMNATATNTGPYITGQTIQLSATGGTTYSWSGPNSFVSTSNPVNISGATLTMAGTYAVTVKQGSCTATATTNVIITESDPCLTVVDYDYVQAGNPFAFKFPLTNNMVIAEVPEETSILVNPICPSVKILSFRMKIVGMPYLHEVVESIPYFALFNNTGDYILGRHLLPGNYVLTITGYENDNAQGNITYGPVLTNFTVVSNSASISAPTFSINSLCAGTKFNVNFTTMGVFTSTNMFEVQLSDANGTFDNPIIIGSTESAGVVLCTVPLNITSGSKYKIRVVSTNQVLSGDTNSSNLVSTTASLNLNSPTNDISSGVSTKQASQIITATNKVFSPANVIYKAGNAILLSAGFQANANAVFKAEISGCN
ncbi:3-coathanger stack domain-containing protein [Emticicia sp. SJ17W-69]|uniref:3-coathanger stack domain-containing protein n=1 Tax=Emticicia sp. SJ17W-69 TaxID=3421657 RepID=UPI003EB8F687